MQQLSSPINLSGRLGTSTDVAPVEEVVVMPGRETVSQVITSPARQRGESYRRSQVKPYPRCTDRDLSLLTADLYDSSLITSERDIVCLKYAFSASWQVI